MRTPLIAGNWKMHGQTTENKVRLQEIVLGAKNLSQLEFAVFPPFVYLTESESLLKDAVNVRLGAQTVSEYANGAYTGDVSAGMLADVGCTYVIIGHSERRAYHHTTNKQVAKKCEAAFSAGLIPIVCVGETLDELERELTLTVVQEQLEVVLQLKDNCANFSQLVVAYEPVWAIGSGKSANPSQVQEVLAAIRLQIARKDEKLAQMVRILYGGSVKPSNTAELFAMPDADGVLVGGASLDAKQFIEIGRLWNK